MRSINPVLVTVIFGFIGILVGVGLIPIIPEVATGPILGTGLTLVAVGVSELLKFYRSTTKLEKPILDIEKIKEDVYRVSALIHNPGNVTVKDTKAVLTIEADIKELRDMLLWNCIYSVPQLVNQINPTIRGEALSWSLPERPTRGIIRLDVFRNIYLDYAHITSISPRQSARLLLFDFAKEGDGYIVGFFSEFGIQRPEHPFPAYYRACFYVGKEIKGKVYVSGEGVRKPLEFCLSISKDILDEVKNLIDNAYLDEAVKKLQGLLNC